MKNFEMTFQVNYIETVNVMAETKEEALAYLHDDELNDIFRVITNLRYEAELLGIVEVK